MGSVERLRAEIAAVEIGAGFAMVDVLTLPEELQKLVNWVMREREVGLQEAASYLDTDPAEVLAVLRAMVDKGLLREEAGRYQVRFAPKQGRRLSRNLWAALEDKDQ